MTVESEAPTDILTSDLVKTNITDITHNNTIESIMFVWNRVVLFPPPPLHRLVLENIVKTGILGQLFPQMR